MSKVEIEVEIKVESFSFSLDWSAGLEGGKMLPIWILFFGKVA